MRKLATLGLAALLVFVVAGSSAATAPPAPTNLAVVSATQTSVTLAWGPTMVANFTAYDTDRKNQLIVAWSPSVDSRGPVSYEVTKNGGSLMTVAVPEIQVSGLNPKIKSFRICVTPISMAGRGPVNCSTFTR